MRNDVIGILNFHSSPSLGALTANRALGSTSFLGRYALCDFALSNFTNSGIEDIGLLIKDHPRSIIKHLGNMNAWRTNTKKARTTIMLNESVLLDPKLNNDVNNIKANDWVLYDSKADYLIFQSSHILANIDLKALLKEHIKRGEEVTVLYKKVNDGAVEMSKEYVMEFDEDGYVVSDEPNPGTHEPRNSSMEVWIVNRTALAKMIQIQAREGKDLSFRHLISKMAKRGLYKIHAVEFKGFAMCFDSFEAYCDNAFELLQPKHNHEFFSDEWPHYTVSHDTPPALYSKESHVVDSFVSNGAIIAGKVKHSIISRSVEIGEGSTVENCIIFSECKIGKGCHLKNLLIDKYSIIGDDVTVEGEATNLKYLKQGTRL